MALLHTFNHITCSLLHYYIHLITLHVVYGSFTCSVWLYYIIKFKTTSTCLHYEAGCKLSA